jgi:hypothetical protein
MAFFSPATDVPEGRKTPLTRMSRVHRTIVLVSAIATCLGHAQARAALLDFNGAAIGSSLFTANGNAAFTAGNAAMLTDGGTNEAGSVFTTQKQSIVSFTSQFEFQITPGTTTIADGITFCIQNSSVNALGYHGAGLGYGPYTVGGTTAFIPNSIAIKFDTFSNGGERNNSTGLYLNGASPAAPGTDLTGTGVNLQKPNPFLVSMAYANSQLAVTIEDLTTLGTATQNYNVNIASVIGGNYGYVGFTGGTGGLTSTQTILSMPDGIYNTPEPGALALLAGFGAMGASLMAVKRKAARASQP